MKILKLLVLHAAFTFLTSTTQGATVMTNEQQAIVAIGSLPIGGILYDISFDGSFGTFMFLGNQTGASAARASITQLLNSYGPYEYFPWQFPTLANQSGGGINGTGTYFEITYAIYALDDPEFPGRRDSYAAKYGAGWGAASGFSYPSYVEATFREAIPGSISGSVPYPIPETGAPTLVACAGVLLLRRRNRRTIGITLVDESGPGE
jgi:hypothetical protein